MQAVLSWGNKHLARTLVVLEQCEFAKFIAGTVPLEGGQLVIENSGNVEAGVCPASGVDDHITFVIEVTVAGECPRGRDGGNGSEEDQAGSKLHLD